MQVSDPVEQIKSDLKTQDSNQNMLLGIIAGIIAAAIGAAIWGIITALTKFQIGWMAVGVGFLVGFAIRTLGKGNTPAYGVIGAVLAFAGCLTGNILASCIMAADELGVTFLKIISILNVEIIIELMKETFSVMDLVFYAIAIYEGYRFSFRRDK